ncbi:MAG: hypothetical protein HZA31_03055 [Opitutae bacterium]|nr:hypothetical protein [Opitutae bacterium]
MRIPEGNRTSTSALARFSAHPLCWVTMAVMLLALDVLTGPTIQFPIAYLLPVGLAAWHVRRYWAGSLAMSLPLGRFGIVWLIEASSAPLWAAVINLLIRVAVLLVLSEFVWRYRRAAREVKVLSGLLPICAYCRKIRDEKDQWQVLENYLPTHSEADLTHGICPNCARVHFPEAFNQQP